MLKKKCDCCGEVREAYPLYAQCGPEGAGYSELAEEWYCDRCHPSAMFWKEDSEGGWFEEVRIVKPSALKETRNAD